MDGRPSPEGTAAGIHPWHPCCRSGDRARGGCGLPRGTEVLAGRRDVEMVGWMARGCCCLPHLILYSGLTMFNSRWGGEHFMGGRVVRKQMSGSYKIDTHDGMKGIEYWGQKACRCGQE